MDETRMLIEHAHQGDKAARERLVMDNVGLVWSVARRFAGRGCEMEDLFQIGSIGLLKAIDHFDENFDVKFSTYAVPMITGEIRRFLRDDGMIKVSRSLKELAGRVRGAREEMGFTLGREPTIEELAQCVGASREEVAASLEAGAQVDSLNRPIKEGEADGICLMDRLEQETDEKEEVLNHLLLGELLEELGERERALIRLRYFGEQTQSSVAAALGMSQVQVSRLEKRVLAFMRKKLE